MKTTTQKIKFLMDGGIVDFTEILQLVELVEEAALSADDAWQKKFEAFQRGEDWEKKSPSET